MKANYSKTNNLMYNISTNFSNDPSKSFKVHKSQRKTGYLTGCEHNHVDVFKSVEYNVTGRKSQFSVLLGVSASSVAPS